MMGGGKRTPLALVSRPRLSAEEFAREYFGEGTQRAEIAVALRRKIEDLYGVDLAGLLPSDTVRDMLLLGEETTADSLDRVERTIALERFAGEVLGRSSWDIETLPFRSFVGLVSEIEKIGA